MSSKIKKGSEGAAGVGGATPKPDTAEGSKGTEGLPRMEGLLSMQGLTSTDDILWGLVGDTCTRSFIRDPKITDKQKWICYKDKQQTRKVLNVDESEVIFTIPKATREDSGQYTFGMPELNMKTNITVRVIDNPRPFKPSVKAGKSGGILLKWIPPVTDRVITGYDVECRVIGETRWTKITPYRLRDCQYTDDDMIPNKIYIYRVIVHNKVGNPWLSENSDEIPYKIEPPAPRIHVSPTMSVNVGDPIDLCVEIPDTCDVVTWSKDDKDLDQGIAEDGRRVTIEKASLLDAGEYTCTAKTGSKYAQQKMKVLVKEKRKDHMISYGFPCVAVVMFAVIVALYLHCAGLKTEIELIQQNRGVSRPDSTNPSKMKTGLDDFDDTLTKSWKGFQTRLAKLETPGNSDTIEQAIPTNNDDIQILKIWVKEFNTTFGSLKSLEDKLKNHTVDIESISMFVKKFNATFESLESLGKKLEFHTTRIEDMSTWFEEFDNTFGSLKVMGGKNHEIEIKNTNTLVKEFNTTFAGLKGLNETLENHTTEIKGINAWVQEFKETFGTVESIIEQIKIDSNSMSAEIGKLQPLGAKFEKVKNETKQLEELLESNTDVIGEVRKNAANRVSAQIVVAVVFIIEVGLAFWIYRIQLKVENKSGGSLATSKTAKQVLEQIPRSVSLDRSICVIGFNNSMSNFHRTMVESTIQGLNVPIKVVVVTRHEQLLRLPHCQLYVMCTEFTERHVIIEEPGLGLGDLKRCTHDVVQRFNANMMIVYINDPGSRSLPQGHLFNKKIHCVSSQPELVRLSEKNMFFSIYDKLTDYQSSSFMENVNSCIQRRF